MQDFMPVEMTNCQPPNASWPRSKMEILDDARRDGLVLDWLKADRIHLAVFSRKSEFGTSNNDHAVILIHGATFSTLSVFHFDFAVNGSPDLSLFNQLNQVGLDVFGIDMDGYGYSDTRGGYTSIETSAGDILRLADRLRREKNYRYVSLIGWSWGAQVAAKAASLDAAEVISNVIFYGGIWGGLPATRPDILADSSWLPDSYTTIPSKEDCLADFYISSEFEEGIVDAFSNRTLAIDLRSASSAYFDIFYRSPLFDPSRIKAPTLVLHGELDSFCSFEDLRSLGDRLPEGSSHQVVEKGSHFLHASIRRKEFLRMITEFLGICSNVQRTEI